MIKLKKIFNEAFISFNQSTKEYSIEALKNDDTEFIPVVVIDSEGRTTYRDVVAKDDLLVQELLIDQIIELENKQTNHYESNIIFNFLGNDTPLNDVYVYRYLNNVFILKPQKNNYECLLFKEVEENKEIEKTFNLPGNINFALYSLFCCLNELFETEIEEESKKELITA